MPLKYAPGQTGKIRYSRGGFLIQEPVEILFRNSSCSRIRDSRYEIKSFQSVYSSLWVSNISVWFFFFFYYNFLLENYSNLARLKNMIFNLLTSIYFNLVKWKSKSLILIKNRDSWFGGLCKNNEQNMRKEFWRAMVLIIDRRISSVS